MFDIIAMLLLLKSTHFTAAAKTMRVQSAMEYLMTYGWAILIIAVVLGTLFSLGTFEGGANLGTSCVAISGIYCQSLILDMNGNLTLNFGQTYGSAFYNVGLACDSSATTTNYPANSVAMVYIFANGMPSAIPANGPAQGALTLQSGSVIKVLALKCFQGSGAGLPSPQQIGSSFRGYLWMNYTTSPVAPSGANPMFTQKVATFTAKVA